MGNDLDILEKMITTPPLGKYEVLKSQMAMSLVEHDGKKYTVTINNLESDCVSIKGDSFDFFDINKKNKRRKPILSGKNGQKRKVDYIIIAESNSERNIFYVELKGRKLKSKEICEKFKGSRCFMKYILEIGKEFWEKDGFLANGGYKARYVLIAKRRGGKITRRQKLRGKGKHKLQGTGKNKLQGKEKHKWLGTGESPEEFLLIPRAAVLEFSDLLIVGEPRNP